MTPFTNEEDTRKVQTAVIGRAGSDTPVFLPYDHDEFDLFMRGRSRDDFYCGTLLGGCGKKLSAKRYTEKKCHFAHRPPVHCRRTANGESSADHLYIGQALTRWLARQNHRQATASYQTVGGRPGGTVDFRLSGGRQLIRVQMARLGLHPWRQAVENLARRADRVEWLFGPDSMLAYDRVESHGYAIRVECRTVGVTREVRIGTQLPGNTIEWTTLEECSLTSQGIITPSLMSSAQGIVARGSAEATAFTTPPLSFPLADDTVAFTGAVPRSDVQSPTGTPGSVYDADIQPLGSTVTRSRIVLPHASTPPNPSRVYLLREQVTLTPVTGITTDTPAWILTAAQTRRLNAREAAAWNGLKPPQPVPATATPLPVKQALALPRPKFDDREIVASFRRTLERTARTESTITWSELAGSVKATPQQFTSEHQLKLLIALDFPRTQDKPVLSSLLTTENGEVPPFFAAVLTGLGWAPGLPGNQVRSINSREQRRAHEFFGDSPVTASPPSPVSPTAPQPQPGQQSRQQGSRSQAAANLVSPARLPTLQLVLAIREHLMARARNGADDITWRELSANTGFDFAALSDERRANLLFRVDEPLKGHDLMYAALVVTDDGKPLRHFPTILQRHGRPVPGLQSEAHQARQLEADRIRDVYASSTSRSSSTEAEPAVAPAPAGRLINPAVTAAIGTLTGLRWRFDHARQAGDLAEAKRVWQAAGKLYGSKLPAEQQAEYRPHLRDMSEWVHDRENENVSIELRQLLDGLVRRQGPAAVEALRDGLTRAKELKRKHHGKLPQDLQDRHRVCEERLAELVVVPFGGDASTPAPEVQDVPQLDEDRLSELAAAVRAVLKDSARDRPASPGP
ncbi:competence protein CoiA family protein [Streptomyces sp. NBC_00873]|uniref:competence protein CoiA family protein n=1 Tax=unclassified Streptomyces TaxID=2593676 RepID=UPI003863ED07|nr:competence protein CoiA family protein [Streptomyces sp. NBC_00873]WTA47000.1 competence protein CoiA family protein [Streptomyces sp. NBC_00842]